MAEALDKAHDEDWQRVLADPEQTRELSEEEVAHMAKIHGHTVEELLELGRKLEEIEVKTSKAVLRRYVIEQLYYALARKSRNKENLPDLTFEIKEFVVDKVSKVLGISLSEEIETQLVEEFTNWAKERKELVAGWGTFTYVPDGKFSLISTTKD